MRDIAPDLPIAVTCDPPLQSDRRDGGELHRPRRLQALPACGHVRGRGADRPGGARRRGRAGGSGGFLGPGRSAVADPVPGHRRRADAIIVVVSHHHEPWDLGVFTSMGIQPRHHRYILLKSRIHYRAGFGDLPKLTLTLDGTGVTTSDNDVLRYRRLRRPIYPLDSHQSAVARGGQRAPPGSRATGSDTSHAARVSRGFHPRLRGSESGARLRRARRRRPLPDFGNPGSDQCP